MTIVLAVSWFESNETLIQAALISALLALSFHIGLRSGVYTFAGVGCWAVGGYTTGILVEKGWAVVPAVVVSIAFGAVVGLVLALVLGRLRSLYLAMATVAFVLLVQILASTLEITGGANGLYGIPIVTTTGSLVAVVVVVCVLVRYGERAARGRLLHAMRTDMQLVPAVGLSVRRQQILTFTTSSALASLAGAMYALTFGVIAPQSAGFDLLVSTLTMVVLGGTAVWIGPVIGAFIVTWLPELLTSIGDWWPAVQGALIVLVVVFAPGGIVGIVQSASGLVAGWLKRARMNGREEKAVTRS